MPWSKDKISIIYLLLQKTGESRQVGRTLGVKCTALLTMIPVDVASSASRAFGARQRIKAIMLVWLKESKSYRVADDILEVASINMQFNVAREMEAIDQAKRTEILSLVG